MATISFFSGGNPCLLVVKTVTDLEKIAWPCFITQECQEFSPPKSKAEGKKKTRVAISRHFFSPPCLDSCCSCNLKIFPGKSGRKKTLNSTFYEHNSFDSFSPSQRFSIVNKMMESKAQRGSFWSMPIFGGSIVTGLFGEFNLIVAQSTLSPRKHLEIW